MILLIEGYYEQFLYIQAISEILMTDKSEYNILLANNLANKPVNFKNKFW